jgi:hypothetical protein
MGLEWVDVSIEVKLLQMQIDNLEEAQDLCDRLEATVPFSVRATKQLLKTMKERGDRVSSDDVFTVDWVKYSGDIGGINCAFEEPDSQQRYVVSITHLKIDPAHPMAEEVVAYQEQRTQRLKLQDMGGFAADLLANSPPQKRRKKSSGFGK